MTSTSSSFNNPIAAFPTIADLFVAILNVMIVVSTPIVVFFIIYAGFMYVTARGNPEKIKIASKALVYGIIGGVVILGSIAIMEIIKNLVNAF